MNAVSDDPFAGMNADEVLDAMVNQAMADLEVDEAVGEMREAIKPPNRLPAARSNVERSTLQSADLDARICIHELASALAIFSGEDPVLAEVPPRYLEVAGRLLDTVALFPKCQTKGAS